MSKLERFRFRTCEAGAFMLKAFMVLSVLFTIIYTVLFILFYKTAWLTLTISGVILLAILYIMLWVGLICVYVSSLQLGIKLRIFGITFGVIPVASIAVLWTITRKVSAEIHFEKKKIKLNAKRRHDKICKTEYPLLLVHGVFFRDSRYFNYWGRIPAELTANGATVFYGEHHSAASVADSAKELSERIKEIVRRTGAEKVNIIAHSKGGLDCRAVLSECDAAKHIASLTTINTPHRGCNFADTLLKVMPAAVKNKVADTYNATLKKLGEKEPDFLKAVYDLTKERCIEMNKSFTVPDGVFCQSVGSKLKKAENGKFPLNMSYHLVGLFDGPNDGLVGTESFEWGEKYTFLEPSDDRGITHGDMIDLNRENINGFDVREFYVQLVHDLKKRGL